MEPSMESTSSRRSFLLSAGVSAALVAGAGVARADDRPVVPAKEKLKRAFVDGTGHGWRSLGADDFTHVNSDPDTWTWNSGILHCTGNPVSVMRTKKQLVNFELVCEWMHLRGSGNSGIFVWTTPSSIEELTKAGKPGLPAGIEIQVLDLEYGGKNKADWYTSHGDVFPVRVEMTPFPPVAPNGKRSFPSKSLSKGINEWNHYYVRAINGEVRLWVNGEEVSGGTGCKPSRGYLCLESEGSPIKFRNLRLRELP